MLHWALIFNMLIFNASNVRRQHLTLYELNAAEQLRTVSSAGQNGSLPSTSSRLPAVRWQSTANVIRNAISLVMDLT